MSRSAFYKTSLAILGIVVLFIAVGLLFPGHGSPETRAKADSSNRMSNIARVVAAYAADHQDNLPQKMSDLVPDYLDDPKLLLFRSPDANSAGDVNLMANRELIDPFSAYSFLRLPDHRLVVFERPGFRKDGNMIYCLLGNDGETVGSFSTCYVSPKEFVQRLDRGFPDVPANGSYQHLQIIGIGAYEYDLDIHGEELQSIQKAFQASGKPPITSDAARKKAQAAMDVLDGPGTWQVEEGIRASDGSTPYYRFRSHRIQDGLKSEGSVDSLVLLDGTVIAPTKTKRPPGL